MVKHDYSKKWHGENALWLQVKKNETPDEQQPPHTTISAPGFIIFDLIIEKIVPLML